MPQSGQIGVIEARLEELVLDQHARAGRQMGVHLGEPLLQPRLAVAHAVLAGVVGAVGEPQAEQIAAGGRHDRAAVDQVRHGTLAHLRLGMTDAAEPVDLVLEHVGVDRPDAHSAVGGVLRQGGPVVHPVPRNVQGDRGRGAAEAVDVGGIVQFLIHGARRAGPREHLEPGAAVAVAPGGGLDRLRLELLLGRRDIHAGRGE